MINLILAILSSTGVALTMRYGNNHCDNKTSMIAVNYVLCLIFSIIYAGGVNLVMDGVSIGLGSFQGLLYLGGFLLLQFSISKNGVVLSSTFFKLGVLVPTLAAIIFFHELPSMLQALGIVIAIVAIIIINLEKSNNKANFKFGLIILLLVGGITDFCAKLYEEYGNSELKGQFVFFTFLSALVICIIIALINKEKLTKRDIINGLLIGIPNYFSAIFLLNAVHYVPATIAYPTYSVATIVCTTIGGVLFFKEKISKRQFVGIGLILISMIMLNV